MLLPARMTLEVPQLQFFSKEIDMPVAAQRHISAKTIQHRRGAPFDGAEGQLRRNEDVVGSRRDVGGEARGELGQAVVSMAEERLAIHETIKLLNDDDTLEFFKATLQSRFSVQVHQSTAAVARRAMDELRRSSRTPSNSASNLKLTQECRFLEGHLDDR